MQEHHLSLQALVINLCSILPLAPQLLLRTPRGLSLSSISLLVMSYGPLFRVPCILVAMVGFTKTLTPPEPPITAAESAPSTIVEVILKHRAAPFTIRVCTSLNSGSWTDFFCHFSDHHFDFRARRGCRHPRLQLGAIRVIEGRLI